MYWQSERPMVRLARTWAFTGHSEAACNHYVASHVAGFRDCALNRTPLDFRGMEPNIAWSMRSDARGLHGVNNNSSDIK